MYYSMTYELLFEDREEIIDAKDILGEHRMEFPEHIALPGVGDFLVVKGSNFEERSNAARTIIGRVEARLFDYFILGAGSCSIRYTLRVVKDEKFVPGQHRDYRIPKSIAEFL